MSRLSIQPIIVDEPDLSAALDAEIRRSLCRCFPADAAVFSCTRQWHGSGPAFSVMIRNDHEVVAHVGVVDRMVRFGEVALRAAGIQNVLVLPEHRGQGLAGRVLQLAQAEAARRGFACGLLFCVPELEPLYARTGWVRLGNEVVRVDDDGVLQPIPGKNIGMFLPLAIEQAPPGRLHLGGNDW